MKKLSLNNVIIVIALIALPLVILRACGKNPENSEKINKEINKLAKELVELGPIDKSYFVDESQKTGTQTPDEKEFHRGGPAKPDEPKGGTRGKKVYDAYAEIEKMGKGKGKYADNTNDLKSHCSTISTNCKSDKDTEGLGKKAWVGEPAKKAKWETLGKKAAKVVEACEKKKKDSEKKKKG